MLAPVTDLGKWKAAHSRPAVIDTLRWNEAVEKITREVFFELRKSIPETTVEAILNPAPGAQPAGEPEADEDDGDDLI